ncbi:hypothetical protein CU305_07335 [Prochlorococcus marinus str. MU1416]|nr:hypothetical protein [Prochlorococcus marinus str. MU1416]
MHTIKEDIELYIIKTLTFNSFPVTKFGIENNTWKEIGKSIKVVSLHKKRPLFLEVFLGVTKSSVSLFPLF